MFHEPQGPDPERYEGIGTLIRFLRGTAEAYRAEGVPVTDDGRIDMQAYADFYPQHLHKDLELIKEEHARYESVRGVFSDKRLENLGERLEMLAGAIFTKNLGDRFVVLRASAFDDIVHKVDTVLFDRTTGNLICAFDEVGDTTGASYERKLLGIRDRNKKGGATIKYGLTMKAEGNRRRIVRSPAQNAPLFYIALPNDRIEKGIEEFVTNGQSDFERKLFEYFMATLDMQVKALELEGNRLYPDLRKKITAFKMAMNERARRERQ